MASLAHCFYCFEVLSAGFDDREVPSLQAILDSHDQYQKSQASQEDTEEDPDEQDSEDPTATKRSPEQKSSDGQRLQPPLFSRLRDLTSSSQSSTSTPSTTSVNSSNTQLTSPNPSTPELPSTYAARLSVTESYPLFVTWNTLSRSGHKSLRGCIGTFEPLPLEKGLEQFSLTSAFEDTRFSPIPPHLMPNLSCSLTLLADFEECDGPMDWELGKHGLRISFTHRYRRYGSTYLPDVAVEQGWTKEETLESLMRKGGYEGSKRRHAKPWEEVKDFKVVRYTGLKASASYAQWQEWQKWAKQKTSDIWS